MGVILQQFTLQVSDLTKKPNYKLLNILLYFIN